VSSYKTVILNRFYANKLYLRLNYSVNVLIYSLMAGIIFFEKSEFNRHKRRQLFISVSISS
jgi:hypothetical protein